MTLLGFEWAFTLHFDFLPSKGAFKTWENFLWIFESPSQYKASRINASNCQGWDCNNPKYLFSGAWEVYDWLSFCTGRASSQQFNLVNCKGELANCSFNTRDKQLQQGLFAHSMHRENCFFQTIDHIKISHLQAIRIGLNISTEMGKYNGIAWPVLGTDCCWNVIVCFQFCSYPFYDSLSFC